MINSLIILLSSLLFPFCTKTTENLAIRKGISIERLSRIDSILNKAIASKEIP